MKTLSILPALLFAVATFAQLPCCTIIDLSSESGTFTIRHLETGRISLFKPHALEGAALKVGDSVDAKFDTRKVIAVKGIGRSYDMLEASPGDSC